MMEEKKLSPFLSSSSYSHLPGAEDSQSMMLPSFPSLRERNLMTLYGDTKIFSDYTDKDKSPKGSVDEKIRTLVDLINGHPEYVTLSSCSGRVALFDPGVAGTANGNGNGYHKEDDEEDDNNNKGTEISGKGRGKWIFVTHDILPDLGPQIIRSLQKVGEERHSHIARHTTTNGTAASNNNNEQQQPPITFKHEPPLLHVAAASLAAGRKLLHIAKSVCAMRESGLVVTDQRVTVELRTTGTMLCLPLMIQLSQSLMMTSDFVTDDALSSEEQSQPKPAVSLVPSEEYLLALADMANERMVQNEILIKKLFASIRDGLFVEAGHTKNTATAAATATVVERHDEKVKNVDDKKYKVTLQSLPPLNLWKTASVVLPRNGNGSNGNSNNGENNNNYDLDVLAFGGQGAGPNIDATTSGKKAPTCRRWDAVFRLARRDGIWSDHWDDMPVIRSAESLSKNNDDTIQEGSNANNFDGGSNETEIKFVTNAGIFRVQMAKGLGPREGHCACVMPPLKTLTAETIDSTEEQSRSSAVVIFGGRAGGPSSPSNDLYLFVATKKKTDTRDSKKEAGMFGRPLDVRGTPPAPRFGHTMTALRRGNCFDSASLQQNNGEPLAVVAGGIGIQSSSGNAVTLASVHILSRIVDNNDDGPGFSHFIWDRISDMPSPRAYHTAFIDDDEQTHSCCMFVFGGIVEVNDPFSLNDGANEGSDGVLLNNASTFKLSLDGKNIDTQQLEKNGTITNIHHLPPLIGSSACTLSQKSNDLVLLVGGTKSPASSDSVRDDAYGPLNVLTFHAGERTTVNEIIQAQTSSIELLVDAESKEKIASETIDFGSCVHHSLLPLPGPSDAASGDGTASAIIVGGGVPSFSFGQTYAKSYLININQDGGDESTTKNTSKNRIKNKRNKSKTPAITSNVPSKAATGKPTIQVDVIYVAARHAKQAKNELESLGLLDKRYKMIKVERVPSEDVGIVSGDNDRAENLIAIPVTKQCTEPGGMTTDASSSGATSDLLESLVVGKGTEMVPYSSSSMSKMKQKRGMR